MAATDGVSGSGSPGVWYENSNAKPQKPADSTDPLASKETFLKLLVAQMRNQNPLNPTDGVQFLSQLAQFSDLEQTVQMREELTAIRTAVDKYMESASKTEEKKGN